MSFLVLPVEKSAAERQWGGDVLLMWLIAIQGVARI